MDKGVDLYLENGCGRCSYYRTPECKVHSWTGELLELRRIVLECGLTETLKWKQPCYTYANKNVVIVTAFKDYAALAFFKGSLLKDPGGILVSPGKNSQAARQLRFTSQEEVIELEPIIKKFIVEAIELEKAGRKVAFKKQPEAVPWELQEKLDADPAFSAAFQALTPGRQRGYILYFSQAKQSKTRTARIDKCVSRILAGKGWNER